MRKLKEFFLKPINATLTAVSFAIIAVSIAYLMTVGIDLPIASWLVDLFTEYRRISAFVWQCFDPIAIYATQLINDALTIIGLQLDLNPWWKSLWTPLFFYASAVARAAWRQYRAAGLALLYLGVGYIVFFVTSVSASSWPLTSSSIWPMVIIGVGFAVFHLSGVLWQARFNCNPNAPPSELLKFIIAYPLGNLAVVLFVAIIAAIIDIMFEKEVSAVHQILSAVFFMALRDLAAGLVGATWMRPPNTSWGDAFWGYGTTSHGFWVLGALVAAVLTVVGAVEYNAFVLRSRY